MNATTFAANKNFFSKLWNVRLMKHKFEAPEERGLNDRKDQILWCQGLAFNFIRKKTYVERKRKQPAVKHIKTVDNSVIIFYFLDHFLFYLFESVFQPFVRENKNRNMWDAASWCVIYINLNTAQDSSRSFGPFFDALNLMDFLCISPFTYFTACLYDFFKPL